MLHLPAVVKQGNRLEKQCLPCLPGSMDLLPFSRAALFLTGWQVQSPRALTEVRARRQDGPQGCTLLVILQNRSCHASSASHQLRDHLPFFHQTNSEAPLAKSCDTAHVWL